MSKDKIISKKNNNKKWLYLGIALLFITIASCFLINTMFRSDSNEGIIAKSSNATTTVKKYKVKMVNVTDSVLKDTFDFATRKVSLTGVLINGKTNGTVNYNEGWIFKGPNNESVYCIEFGQHARISNGSSADRKIDNSSDYWKKEIKNKEYIEIISAFANQKVTTKNEEAKHMAAQVLIWEFQQGWRKNTSFNDSAKYQANYKEGVGFSKLYNETVLYAKDKKNDTRMYVEYKRLISKIVEFKKMPSFSRPNTEGSVILTKEINWNGSKFEHDEEDKFKVLSDTTYNIGVTCNKDSFFNDCSVKTSGGKTYLHVEAKTDLSQAKAVKITKQTKNTSSLMIIDDGNSVEGKYQRMIVGQASPQVAEYIKFTTEPRGTIRIIKRSDDNKFAGIKFEVTGKFDGKTTTTQTIKSCTENKEDPNDIYCEFRLKNVKLGTYTIAEKGVDTSYYKVTVKGDESTVTLDKDNLTVKSHFYNRIIKKGINIYKVEKDNDNDDTNNKPVSGATLTLTGPNNFSETWTTQSKNFPKLTVGKYQLCETKAPAGFIKNDQCMEINVTATMTDKDFYYYNTPTTVTVKKVDQKGQPVLNATLELYEADASGKAKGEAIDSWTTSKTNTKVINNLVVGKTYVIKEKTVPDGYIGKDEQTFKFNKTGETWSVIDYKISVQVSKKSSSGALIAGAVLAVYEDSLDGEPIYTFDATDGVNPQTLPESVIGKLQLGHKYFIYEVTVPSGYKKEGTKSFSVDASLLASDGIVKIDIINNPVKVYVSKTDITGSKEVVGATIQIQDSSYNVITKKDSSGNEIKLEWKSDGKTKEIDGSEWGLVAGNKYYLVETYAPEGYATNEIEFTYGADGVSRDKPIKLTNELTEVTVYKLDESTKQPVIGATLQVYLKEGGTKLEGMTCVTSKDPCVFKGLPTDKELVIKEEKTPENYKTATDKVFKLNKNEAKHTETIYDTPIVPVENTADNASIVKIIIGSILVIGGVGAIILIRKGVRED